MLTYQSSINYTINLKYNYYSSNAFFFYCANIYLDCDFFPQSNLPHMAIAEKKKKFKERKLFSIGFVYLNTNSGDTITDDNIICQRKEYIALFCPQRTLRSIPEIQIVIYQSSLLQIVEYFVRK